MRNSAFNTLSGRFLGLMVVFVIIAEVLIFVPSVARYRTDYLQNRLELAQLGALAVLAAPDATVTPELGEEILRTAGVNNIVLRRDEVRELILQSEMPVSISSTVDLENATGFQMARQAMRALWRDPGDRVMRVVGRSTQGEGIGIEITLPERPVRDALWEYGRRILYVSLVITLATAGLLFFAVRTLIVRPIDRVVAHMMAYRDDPEDARRVIEPGEGAREIVEAEAALRDLQLRLTAALRQKDRLAALGGAVAKISHDLRNMLTTAQLLADRLEASADPAVRKTAPKLVASITRAVSLCERTMTFGRAEEPAPDIGRVALGPLVEEVLEAERLAGGAGRTRYEAEIAPGLDVRADPDQLFRVLTNLVRNAGQAIEASGREGAVLVRAAQEEGTTTILVSDTGPGLPAKARENLFKPFRGGARRGGAGLGLVIAAELVRGHGGTLTLAETGPGGTTFRIALPG